MKIFGFRISLKYRELIILLVDISIVSFSFLITTFGRFDFDIVRLLRYGFQMNFLKAIGVITIYLISFYIFKVYKSLWKYLGIQEAKNISFSVLFATILLLIYCLLFNNQAMLINIIIVSGMLTILSMFSVRVGYRMYRYNLRDYENCKKGIIIGAGDAGYILLKELEQNNNSIKILGFVDDNKVGIIISGKKVLGTIDQLPNIISSYHIDVVYYAIPSISKSEKKRILSIVEQLNVKVKIMNINERTIENSNSFEKKYPIEDISIEDLLGRGEITLDQKEIQTYIENQVICVTGAGGSIGSELCRQIMKFKPSQLLMIDLNENGLYMLEQEFNRKRENNLIANECHVISLVASIRDICAINEIFATFKPSTVFHAAAHKHVPLMETRPQEAIKNNVFGTNNVINACIDNKINRFIMISTDKAVNPTNVMGATKRMTELILESNRSNGVTKLAAVRFGNVLGSNGSVIPIFKEQIKNGGPVTVTDRNIVRYFMTIPEAAQLVLQAGFYANEGEIFVLDMGKPVKIIELAEKMIRLSGYKPYEDIDIIEIGLRPGEKMFEELHLENEIITKTKNDLIFVNKPKNISMNLINLKLEILESILSKSATQSFVKEELLKLISEKEVM